MSHVAIVTELRCPVCDRKYYEARISIGGNALPSCQGKRCRAKWWAFRLKPGSLRAQMLEEFQTDVVYNSLREYMPELPDEIIGDAYLQITLAPEVAYNAPVRGILWLIRQMGWAA